MSGLEVDVGWQLNAEQVGEVKRRLQEEELPEEGGAQVCVGGRATEIQQNPEVSSHT